MKNLKIETTYRSEEDCNCSGSHDTVVINDFDTIEEALSEINNHFEDYEACAHSVIKSASIEVISNENTKSYSIANQIWNYKTKTWNEVDKFEMNINTPNDEWEN